MVFDGQIDGPTILAYVEQILTPARRHGDSVVMDTWRATRVQPSEVMISAIAATRLLHAQEIRLGEGARFIVGVCGTSVADGAVERT